MQLISNVLITLHSFTYGLTFNQKRVLYDVCIILPICLNWEPIKLENKKKSAHSTSLVILKENATFGFMSNIQTDTNGSTTLRRPQRYGYSYSFVSLTP